MDGKSLATLKEKYGIDCEDPGLAVALAAEKATMNYDSISTEFTSTDLRALDTPIRPGCDCLVCRQYSVAYLHHLQDMKELNFNILLGVHNLHTMDQFFKSL
jgi:tRNA-guanine family transglycosylase